MSDRKQPEIEQTRRSHKVWLWVKRWWLPIAILLITSTGLACALSIPQQVFETPREPANDKSAPVLLAQSNLRLAFLYITGGAIAVVGLIETFRKNNNEKLKNDQDKEKNDREHLRQVRADRRERYTKAVEQLGDEKAPIRMGGVYTLVGLVDEWLEEENLSEAERLKEGQVIINNLCAYIRNPYKSGLFLYDTEYKEKILADAKKDKSALVGTSKESYWQETSVRLAILEEMKKGFNQKRSNKTSWSKLRLNLSHSKYTHELNLDDIFYDGHLSILYVIVYDSISIKNANISGYLELNTVEVSGSLDTTGSEIRLGTTVRNIQVSGQLKLGGEKIISNDLKN